MTSVAVIAHREKSLGGGLGELRKVLAAAGIAKPLWYEVSQSKRAPKKVRDAVKAGAELIFVWGGDGMVQQCIDVLAGSGVVVAILPAGTANLLATELGIPRDLEQAVRIGLHGPRRQLDVGKINGERFAVMAGIGLDGRIMRGVDGGAKERLGRLAYIRSGLQAVRRNAVGVRVRVDGADWFAGKGGCVLLGNIGTVTGGLRVFPDAQPDDGVLEVGVAMAQGPIDWIRVFASIVAGRPALSPLVHLTRGRRIEVRLDRAVPYQLDGGARKPTARLKVRIQPAAITVCVPEPQPKQA